MATRIQLVLIAFLAVIVFAPLHAFAAANSDAQFALVPVTPADSAITEKGYFIYPAAAGKTITGAVLLKSGADHAINITLAEVEAQTAQTGGSAFSAPGVAVSGTATWLKLDQDSVTLQPQEQRQVGFSLAIPASVAPGQYLAGIAAYIVDTPVTAVSATQAPDQAHAGISLQMRQVIAVEADVSGEWQSSLSIPGVSLIEQPSGDYLGVQMRNDGATFLQPAGTLTISDASGKRLAQQQISMGTFVPGTTVVYPAPLTSRPALGDYKVSVDLSYDKTKTAHYDGVLTVKAPASNDTTAPATGPLDLSTNNSQPAAAPATTSIAHDSGNGMFIMVGVAAILVAIICLAAFFVLLRRRLVA